MSDRDFTKGGGSMRRTVYNRSGVEVGVIIDGCMYAVPAGTPGGGPGTLICSERIAEVLAETNPVALSLSAGCYTAQDVARMKSWPASAVKTFCEELMLGSCRRLEDLEREFATAEAERLAGKPGSAAGGKAA